MSLIKRIKKLELLHNKTELSTAIVEQLKDNTYLEYGGDTIYTEKEINTMRENGTLILNIQYE